MVNPYTFNTVQITQDYGHSEVVKGMDCLSLEDRIEEGNVRYCENGRGYPQRGLLWGITWGSNSAKLRTLTFDFLVSE